MWYVCVCSKRTLWGVRKSKRATGAKGDLNMGNKAKHTTKSAAIVKGAIDAPVTTVEAQPTIDTSATVAQVLPVATVNRLVAIAQTARAKDESGEVYCITGQQRAFAVVLRKLCIERTGSEAMGNSLAAKLCVYAMGYSLGKGHAAVGETSASGMQGYMRWAKANGNTYSVKMKDKCDAVAHKVQRLFDTHAASEGYTSTSVVSDKPSA